MADTNGWAEYKRQVLFQLEQQNEIAKELNQKIDALRAELGGKIDALREDVTVLKVKAGAYGAISGMVMAIITALIMKLLGE